MSPNTGPHVAEAASKRAATTAKSAIRASANADLRGSGGPPGACASTCEESVCLFSGGTVRRDLVTERSRGDIQLTAFRSARGSESRDGIVTIGKPPTSARDTLSASWMRRANDRALTGRAAWARWSSEASGREPVTTATTDAWGSRSLAILARPARRFSYDGAAE